MDYLELAAEAMETASGLENIEATRQARVEAYQAYSQMAIAFGVMALVQRLDKFVDIYRILLDAAGKEAPCSDCHSTQESD